MFPRNVPQIGGPDGAPSRPRVFKPREIQVIYRDHSAGEVRFGFKAEQYTPVSSDYVNYDFQPQVGLTVYREDGQFTFIHADAIRRVIFKPQVVPSVVDQVEDLMKGDDDDR